MTDSIKRVAALVLAVVITISVVPFKSIIAAAEPIGATSLGATSIGAYSSTGISSVSSDGKLAASITGNDESNKNITVTAQIANGVQADNVKLYYKQSAFTDYIEVEMQPTETAGIYSAVLTKSGIWTNSLEWYVKLTNTDGSIVTATANTDVVCAVNSQTAAPLLITEIVPATEKGTTYTYFELYNNSDTDIDLKDYTIYYTYPGGTWLEWTFDGQSNSQGTNHHPTNSIMLNAGKTMIVWPGGTTTSKPSLSTFNSYYGTSFVAGKDIIRINHGGFHSTDKRTLRIGKTSNNIISSSACNDSGTDNPTPIKAKMSNQYTFRNNGNIGYKVTNMATATPGVVESWQIPDAPVDYPDSGKIVDPILDSDLTYKTTYGAEDAVTISANIKGVQGLINVNLYYSQGGNEFRKLAMTTSEKGSTATYSVTINRSMLWAESFNWYIEAGDGDAASTVKSSQLTSNVTINVDYANEPPLIFTEALPVYKTGYQYTYAEIYNNSDKAINLSYYKLFYQYTGTTTAPKTWSIAPPDVYLDPGKTMVLWLTDNGSTVQQFNETFGTNLVLDKDIVIIDYSGFHNSQWRRLSIGRTLETAFTHAEFNENNIADVTSASNRAVQYTYPRDVALGQSIKATTTKEPSPGVIESWQVPAADKKVVFQGYPEYTDTGSYPSVTEVSIPEAINEGEELFTTFQCSDDMGLVGMSIFYRFDGKGEFTKRFEASQRVKGKFFARIPATEVLNHKTIEFYVEGYNIYHKTNTKTYTVKINSLNPDELRINVANSNVIAGTKTITANDGSKNENTKISVDSKEVAVSKVLENGAYLSVLTGGQDNYFKNVVTAPYSGNEHEIVSYLGKWTNLDARAVFVDNKYFTIDENGNYNVKLTLWAGNSGTPFEDIYSAANHDDYTATNIKLVLANGEEILAKRAAQDHRYSGDTFFMDVENPEYNKIYKIGDSKNGTMSPRLDVYFTIPKDKLTAVGYVLDTKALSDGLHTISATDGSETKSANVIVDNTKPVIDLKIKSGDLLKGTITIDPELSDANGIDLSMLSVAFDGKPISVPSEIPTRELSSGEHKLSVAAADICGNIATAEVTFLTDTKNPDEVSTLTSEISTNQAKLVAAVGNINGSEATIEFLKGKLLTVENGDITVQQGAGNGPMSIVSGGTNFTAVSPDGDLPYQVFTIKVGAPNENDKISANWNGKVSYADNSHALSMYVFNFTQNKWELLSKADVEGNINVSFAAKNHVNNGNATLLVQCRADDNLSAVNTSTSKNTTVGLSSSWDGTARPDNYDFSLAWITDTQYYAETWNDHIIKQNQWIVDNAKDLDIRYTIDTGDIVDEFDMDYQWQLADKSLKIFDENNMPYGVLAGNHDVAAGNQSYKNYWKYFGAQRFTDKAYYGGTYNNNLGHYDLLTEDGQDLIMLYMSWDIYEDEINWMNEVLAKYSDRKAIICLHRYTNVKEANGTLLDYAGQVLQANVVAKNPNVIAVLNGHYHGSSIQVDSFDDDKDGVKERLVYQICTDYQSDPEGGSQYIKFLFFDLKNNKIYMNSYSPYRDDYNYYDTDKLDSYSDGLKITDLDIFELDVNFNTAEKALSTNRFSASLYTNDLIGKVQNVKDKAEVVWKGLNDNTSYSWYANIINENGGIAVTPVNVFRTETETSSDESNINALLITNNGGSYASKEQIKQSGTTTQLILNENTIISSELMGELLVKNKDNDVVIQSKDIAICFAKGTMKDIPERMWFDFGAAMLSEQDAPVLKQLAGDSFIAGVSYNYSGELPAQAAIIINVGKQYADKTMYYYYYNEGTKKLELMQNAVVDMDGFVTVYQTHCSDYVITDKNLYNQTVAQDKAKAWPINPKTGSVLNMANSDLMNENEAFAPVTKQDSSNKHIDASASANVDNETKGNLLYAVIIIASSFLVGTYYMLKKNKKENKSIIKK